MNTHKILIYDQEEAVRDSLHFVLSEEGYRCFSTGCESEAMKLLHDGAISLVIMESELPELMQMVESIKQMEPFIKIVLISSYAETEITQQALSYGADDFVLEPLDFDELLTRIKNLLLPAAG